MTDEQRVEAERREIIARVVAAMVREGVEINHTTVAARIEAGYPGFDYSVADGDNYLTAKPEPIKLSEMDIAPEPPVEPKPVPAPATVAEIGDSDSALDRLVTLNQKAAELRASLNVLARQRLAVRERLGLAVQALANRQKPLSPADLTRQYLAASLAERAARADGTRVEPVKVFGRSVIDRQAGYSIGGNASDHVRRQMRGGGYRRGAYPSAARGARIPRPPSER
jgi:hypothetical protein